MSIKMKELPISERPYEKLEMYGAHTLSNAELLAIIIKNGTKEESSVTLAQKILSLNKNECCTKDNLTFLQDLSMDELKNEKREIVKVIIMNSRNIILKILTISQGGTSSVQVDTKDILMEAIKIGAPKIIMVHNHPSGETEPSAADIEFTKRLEKAAEVFAIQLLDHIIIGYNQYTSIKSYLLEKEVKKIK